MSFSSWHYGETGFLERWISYVMGSVTTLYYSILINGKPYGNLQPLRGLYQGDPLSIFVSFVCRGLYFSFGESRNGEMNQWGFYLQKCTKNHQLIIYR